MLRDGLKLIKQLDARFQKEKQSKTEYVHMVDTICKYCACDKLDDDIIEEISREHYFKQNPCGDCHSTRFFRGYQYI